MLLMTKTHFDRGSPICSMNPQDVETTRSDSTTRSPYTGVSHFLPSSQKIVQFADGLDPKVGAKIYIIFVLFHVGLCNINLTSQPLRYFPLSPLLISVQEGLKRQKIKNFKIPTYLMYNKFKSILSKYTRIEKYIIYSRKTRK